MVSVRKSHQITVQSFEQWLTGLALTDVKANALSALWLQVCNYYHYDDAEKLELLNKSMEMVEILSGLNLDADSLVAAFMSPLLANNIINIEYVKEHISKAILIL
jgi:GTP pyrophosphokinase